MVDDTFDDDLWAHAVADVKPLKGRDNKTAPKKKVEPTRNYGEDLKYEGFNEQRPTQHTDSFNQNRVVADAHTPTYAEEPDRPCIITSQTAKEISGYRDGVDAKLRKKLSRGEFGFSHKLDLHGYFEGDAWMAVMDYLHDAHASGHRCVLIVSGKGKGYGDDGDMGIIKSQMATWLSHHPKVLAFHSAIPRDGGSGAIYVYLKRDRTR